MSETVNENETLISDKGSGAYEATSKTDLIPSDSKVSDVKIGMQYYL